MEQIPALNTIVQSPPIPESNKYKLAFVIDGVVVTTVLTDARTAAIFTSSPTVVQIEVNADVVEGSLYDGVSFQRPTTA
jgi:hypothetical protein